MNVEAFRTYCLSKQYVTESFPFDDVTLVFKVANKMFALLSLDSHPATANLKCEPQKALLLRNKYSEIIPGYHMNKEHWNTITIESKLTDTFIKEMIDDSYQLVVDKFTKKRRKELGFN